MTDDERLKRTFDQEAELYNKIRPLYPNALFEALIEVTGLSPKARLLEIGPGTGQATKPLADQGYDITAIELGVSLSKLARKELRSYPNVKVITGAFEKVELPVNTYDAVFSATAFHWVDPAFKYAKTHKILKNRGYLAIIHANHVSDEVGNEFFHKSQSIYAAQKPQ